MPVSSLGGSVCCLYTPLSTTSSLFSSVSGVRASTKLSKSPAAYLCVLPLILAGIVVVVLRALGAAMRAPAFLNVVSKGQAIRGVATC